MRLKKKFVTTVYVSVMLIYSQCVALFLRPVHWYTLIRSCNKPFQTLQVAEPDLVDAVWRAAKRNPFAESLLHQPPKLPGWESELSALPGTKTRHHVIYSQAAAAVVFIVMSNFLTHPVPSASLRRLWAVTADDVRSGNWTVHVNSAATWRHCCSQSAQRSGGSVLVQILLRQRHPARQR